MADKNPSDFLEDIWGRRAEGLPVSTIDWSRPVAHEDVEFLLKLYPFLQILTTDLPGEYTGTNVIKEPSGWILCDYGFAMSTSAADAMYGSKISEEDEEADEGEGGEGQGTIINQSYLMAVKLVTEAKKKGWPGIYIVDGTPFMKAYAWMAAKNLDLSVTGYDPTEKDQKQYEKIEHLRAEKAAKKRPKPGSDLQKS